MVQGGLEPIVALGREDLGPASVLSRTDGQGEDDSGCNNAEKKLRKSLYIAKQGLNT